MKPIVRDEQMERDYIPLAGGFEWQTKGKGSTPRLLCPDGDRVPLSSIYPDFVMAEVEAMVRAQHREIEHLTAALQSIHRRVSNNPETPYWEELEKVNAICEKHLSRHGITPKGLVRRTIRKKTDKRQKIS